MIICFYEIPIIIGGKEIQTGNIKKCRKPHDHQHILAEYHHAGTKEVLQGIEAANKAWHSWSVTPLNERTAIFRRAAKLLSGPWRDIVNAATMLNQSKNVFQAEIDAACELIDFFNFNAKFAEEICTNQPLILCAFVAETTTSPFLSSILSSKTETLSPTLILS